MNVHYAILIKIVEVYKGESSMLLYSKSSTFTRIYRYAMIPMFAYVAPFETIIDNLKVTYYICCLTPNNF